MSVMTPLPRMPVKLAASLVGRGGRLSAGCAAAAVGAGGAVSGASVPGTTPGRRPHHARKAGICSFHRVPECPPSGARVTSTRSPGPPAPINSRVASVTVESSAALITHKPIGEWAWRVRSVVRVLSAESAGSDSPPMIGTL